MCLPQQKIDDQESIATGDARMTSFLGKRGWQFGILGPFFVVTTTLCWMLIISLNSGNTIDSFDFHVYWTAAKYAFNGEPLEVFNIERFSIDVNGHLGTWFPWLYAPGYLLILTPFGTLSFPVALLCFNILSIMAMVFAIKPFVASVKPAWFGFALAPGFLPCLMVGQNSVLWFAGLLAALWALRSGYWALAGVILGVLTLKPQLGLVIPFALLAIRAWRTIAFGAASTIITAVIPTLLYGGTYWIQLKGVISKQAIWVTQNIYELDGIVSPLSFLVGINTPIDWAQNIQWVFSAALAYCTYWVWRKSHIGYDVKLAFLFCAIPLASPYLWYYDTVSLPICALFLFRAGALNTKPLSVILFLILWLGAAPCTLAIIYYNNNNIDIPVRIITTPILMGALFLCLKTIFSSKNLRINTPKELT